MASTIELSDVSKVLDAIDSGLSEDNRALIKSNLTRRAFVLGVCSALDQLYSDPESQQVLDKYMLKTLARTMFCADPFEATGTGQAFKALEKSVHEALTKFDSLKVDQCSNALITLLEDKVQLLDRAVHENMPLLADISGLLSSREAHTSSSETANRVLRLLEVLRRSLIRMELGRET